MYVTPEKDSRVTEEKEIGDLFMQMEKCNSPICFSPVFPEYPSGVAIRTKIKNRALEEISGLGVYKEKSHIVEGPQK